MQEKFSYAGRKYGSPPLEFPHIGQQIKFKRDMRKIYWKMGINKYLSESDSDLDGYESVSSEQLPFYTKKYRKVMNLDKQQRGKKRNLQEKEEKLSRLLNASNNQIINTQRHSPLNLS